MANALASAVSAVGRGDAATLQSLVSSTPDLARERFTHSEQKEITLLHLAVIWRRRSCTQALLKAGLTH